jgi:hypothetical protein
LRWILLLSDVNLSCPHVLTLHFFWLYRRILEQVLAVQTRLGELDIRESQVVFALHEAEYNCSQSYAEDSLNTKDEMHHISISVSDMFHKQQKSGNACAQLA